MALVVPGVPLDAPIALDTAERHDIENYQGVEISQVERNMFPAYEIKYGGMATRRSGPSAVYNCHGLTFASRRTCIHKADVVQLILSDDRYKEVARADVLPGDVVLYYGEDGDIEHSAVVVTRPND